MSGFSKEIFDTVVAADLATLVSGQSSQTALAYAERQTQALTEKYVSEFTATPAQRWAAALDKFLVCEQIMESSNAAIRSGLDALTEDILTRVQHKLFGWLPPVTDELLNRMCESATPGPGSTVGRKGPLNRLGCKLLSFTSTTKSASVLLTRFYLMNPAWIQRANRKYPSFVRGDTLFAAPKNAEIDRVCGKQPDFNVTLQLGLWAVVEPFLRSAGLYLRDQTVGWAYARRGSVDGSYATVDLSSASDLIAYELVRRIFPADWFALLSILRSPEYTYCYVGGEPVTRRYEKFSAMGNGFTFPLESLIFKGICDAIIDRNYADRRCSNVPRSVVYGDDIIIPADCYSDLVHVLRALGMNPNQKKSFAEGPFRETCGKEYFHGVDIRPWFIDKAPVNEVEVYILHNTIRTHSWYAAFPRTLEYLRTLVVDPFTQPPYYGAGENWIEWEEWKVREAAFGFMVDVPTMKPTWHPDFQSQWWKLPGWRYCAKLSGDQDEQQFIPLSLHTGSHRVYDFRQGYWKLRSKSVGAWLT